MKRWENPGDFPVWVLLLASLFGGWLLANSVRQLAAEAASERWQATVGELTASSYSSTSTYTKGHKVYRYWPKVAYTYRVDGATFAGERVAFGEMFERSEPAIQAFLQAKGWTQGAEVEVYFDPSAPERSVLLKDVETTAGHTNFWVLTSFGALMLLGGLLGLKTKVQEWRSRRLRKSLPAPHEGADPGP